MATMNRNGFGILSKSFRDLPKCGAGHLPGRALPRLRALLRSRVNYVSWLALVFLRRELCGGAGEIFKTLDYLTSRR